MNKSLVILIGILGIAFSIYFFSINELLGGIIFLIITILIVFSEFFPKSMNNKI